MRSNLAILGIAVLALLIAVESSSAEVIYPWCAQYSTKGGARNCGFTTWEQCRATVSGIGGYCIENPFYQPAADPAVRRKPRRASSSATVFIAPAEAARPDGRPLPSLHSDMFFPVPEPTIKTGILTMTSAVLNLMGK